MKTPISVCILTKNAEKTIEKTLNSVQQFDEVLLLDTGSTDETRSIASKYCNTTIHQTPFTKFGPLRNHLASLAKHPWILALDSDETLPPNLLKEIESLSLDPLTAYGFSRHNFYQGKRIRGCGWSPDRVLRLYHKDFAQFSSHAVHEALQAKKTHFLKHPLHHTPYRTTQDFLHKMQHYSDLFASDSPHKKSSFSKALLHATYAFFRSYILKRGILDGKAGFIISIYNANTTLYKYLKLAERNYDRKTER